MMKAIFAFSIVGLLAVIRSDAAAIAPQSADENVVRLVLPSAIYSVPGREMNLYFDNVILVPNIKNYLFDVDCTKGRQDSTRWRFTPSPEDVGKHAFRLKILNGLNEIIAEGSSELYVTPADAGAGRDITILLIGDSLTDAARYPNELNRLLQAEENPKVRFIGSHAGSGLKPDMTHVAHEGRSGWQWATFCTRWAIDEDDYRAKSPFLFIKEGAPQLDFQAYCDKYNDGQAPDFITVFLGCNDTFGGTDQDIEALIDSMFKYTDILISEFRKVSKTTQIGLLLLVPPAEAQDAFGNNDKCGQTRWQYRRNQHRVVERMVKTYGDKKKDNIFLIPTYINIDCDNNYPKEPESINSRNTNKILRGVNGVHPADEGYDQIADSVYCWLKYQLSLRK